MATLMQKKKKLPFYSINHSSNLPDDTQNQMPSFTLFFLFLTHFTFTDGTVVVIVNSCNYSVWPGLLGNAGHLTPRDGGFHLAPGEQTLLQLPDHWSGRLWPRQGCRFDRATGKGSCQTGDCAGLLQCRGNGGNTPTTILEMTLGTPVSGLHYYDVSLVDGFNVPVSMVPVGGRGGCGGAACEVDLNECCPERLAVKRGGRVVGCKSACVAARTDWYCCRGEYTGPDKCRPSVFARVFKAVCPKAYSYAYDDASGLMTCVASRYLVTFCPSF